jgi:predicted CoA-binding protein
MRPLESAVQAFLRGRRFAVAGVSREGNLPANLIFRKLRDAGYEVVPVNPHAEEVEGVRCYAALSDVPGELDGLVIATPPEAAPDLVRACIERGIGQVWMHRLAGPGSVSEEAVALAREAGIAVIPGSCPMMWVEPVDAAHRCFRWVLRATRCEAEPVGAGVP